MSFWLCSFELIRTFQDSAGKIKGCRKALRAGIKGWNIWGMGTRKAMVLNTQEDG